MLVDRLEAVINSGFRWPMTGKVQIDEREALDVLDLMRTTIPEEIKQARRVNQERERILAQAQTEANRLVVQAQERVERMLSEDSVTIQAQQRAQEIIEAARQEAEEVRRGADDYALDLLDRLDAELNKVQNSVSNALHAMNIQPPAEQTEDFE